MLMRLFHDDDARSWVCDLVESDGIDLDAVDAIARLHLATKRAGASFIVRHPNVALIELLELAGLSEVLAIERD